MAKIVLAHGFLGFGESPLSIEINYFNGVKKALCDCGHDVFTPSVDPLGSLDRRSAQLAGAIAEHWPDDSDISVIAHSMGGLDTRRIIARHGGVGRRIKNLIAIATPHLGSPVADAVLDKANTLHKYIPAGLLEAYMQNTGAIEDLRKRTGLHDPDCPGVRYMEVVCVPPASWSVTSQLFELTRAIGEMEGENDGLVTVTSACCPPREPIERWPVDHVGAIGWPSHLLGLAAIPALLKPPADHIERYVALARRF